MLIVDQKEWFCKNIKDLENGMYRLSYSILKNEADAEDAVQEAIYKSYKNLENLTDKRKFKPWIYKIVTNTSLEILKNNKNYVDISPIFVEEISNKKKPGTENKRTVTYDTTNNSITFDVFATDKEFILQFYRTAKPAGEMWDPANKTVYVLDNGTQTNYVTFSFTENTSSSGGSTAAN